MVSDSFPGVGTRHNPADSVAVQLGFREDDDDVLAYKIGLLNAGYMDATQGEDGEEVRQELPWTRGTGANRRSLSVGPFYLMRDVYGGMPAALFHAVAICRCDCNTAF